MAQVEPARPAARPAPAAPAINPVRGKVRVALVGCGAATRELHLPVLAGHEGVELVALVDRDLARARELARAYRVGTVLGDVAQLDRGAVDGALVCTPPFHHGPCAVELARRGIHVLVEKPMATSYDQGVEMVRAAREAGVVLSVGVFRRLLPATRLLRGLIDSGWLGRPVGFDVEEGEVYNWPTATLGNMRRDLAGGGVLIDFGSHTMDRLLFLFPGAAAALEYRDNARGGIESDCVARLRLTARDGTPVEGRVELSRTRTLRNSFRVRCERGTLELPSGERYKVAVLPDGVTVTDPLLGEARDYRVEVGWAAQAESPWFEAFRAQVDDWVGAIRGGQGPQLSGASVLPSLKLIEECYARPQPLAEPWVEEGLGRPPAAVHASALAVGDPQTLRVTPHGNGTSRRVLVTGATGFIGGRLAEVLSLRDGWQVRALVHNPSRASRLARLPVEMVLGDLHSEQDAARLTEGCDAVVHCAIGTAWGNRREIFDVTVGGTRRLASAARANKVGRFVHLSTFAVHDLTKGGIIDESTPPGPPRGNDYAVSKAEADRVVEQTARDGLCAVTLRLANVYGPFSTIFTTRPVQYLGRGSLVLVGPAETTPSSTVYVDSVVGAIVRALEAPDEAVRGQLFTISDGDDLTWADFYGYFARALGVPLRTISDEEFARKQGGRRRGWLGWALTPIRGVKEVVTSPEMWGLTKRVLKTEPVYSLGRWSLEKVPPLGRRVRRWLGVDAPVVYQREPVPTAEDVLEFDLTRPLVSNAKARRVLGFEPPVPRRRALELTLEWLRHARIIP